MVNESRDLNEVELKVFNTLLEKFGEPIGKTVITVGVADEGSGKKKTVKDDALDRNWSDPDVVHEGEDCACDEMSEDMDEAGPAAHKIPLKKN